MTWTDGAQQGVGAEAAAKACIGGEKPEALETVEQMAARIRSAPLTTDTYDGTATATARIILEALERWPELQKVPSEVAYITLGEGDETRLVATTRDLYDILKQIHGEDSVECKVMLGLTGFQWGWAYNAALRCLGLDEVPNPALLEIG